jgi:hypothetical protein
MQQRLKKSDVQALMREVFCTDAGRTVLSYLEGYVGLYQPTYVRGAQLQDVAFVEGMKTVVRKIHELIGVEVADE